jgi:hypothetical protein
METLGTMGTSVTIYTAWMLAGSGLITKSQMPWFSVEANSV